jgi:lipopolysaccharide export system permease protein
MAYQVSTFRFEEGFVLKDIWEAQEARWNGKYWELYDVKIFNTQDNKIIHHKSLPFDILEPPETLVKEIKRPEEMNIFELYRYYNRIRESGYRNVKYEVDIYGKLTFPIMNLVMILFGLALSLQKTIQSGILAMGFGVLIIILYWVFYSVSMMLGYAEFLPPWLAPWISPVLFGAGGSFLFIYLKE